MHLSESETNARLKQWRPLVVGISRQFMGRLCVLHDRDDAIAIGMVALWRAIQDYDESAGTSFGGFARQVIIYAYLNEVANLNTDIRRVAYHCKQSVDATDEEGRPTFTPRALEDRDGESELIRLRDERALASALAALPARLSLLVRRKFEDGKTLKDIGDDLGISRERARQLEADALRRLRGHLVRAEMAARP